MCKILLQTVNTKEVRAISKEIMLSSDAIAIRSSLEGIDSLNDSTLIPVGSVEFCHAYANKFNIEINSIDSCPKELRQFLGREAIKVKKKDYDRTKFVKPVDVKLFTGFYGETDDENMRKFDALSDGTLLYQSKPIDIVSEYRYYVANKTILGFGRYDQNDYEKAPKPLASVVFDAIAKFDRNYYAIDFGVLKDGRTVLIEVNNCYAIGLYEGNMTSRKYFDFLVNGWKDITNGDSE